MTRRGPSLCLASRRVFKMLLETPPPVAAYGQDRSLANRMHTRAASAGRTNLIEFCLCQVVAPGGAGRVRWTQPLMGRQDDGKGTSTWPSLGLGHVNVEGLGVARRGLAGLAP